MLARERPAPEAASASPRSRDGARPAASHRRAEPAVAFGHDLARFAVSAAPAPNASGGTAHTTGPGRPLPRLVRTAAERVLDTPVPDVRVHTGGAASAAARSVGAQAYTRGRDVVLGSGLDRLDTRTTFPVLAHELAHAVQQRAAAPAASAAPRGDPVVASAAERDADAALGTHGRAPMVALGHHELQRLPIGLFPPPWPLIRHALGEDVVFIMGQDQRGSRNRFYTSAERYYRAHVPGATFVTNVRSLDDVLAWVRDNVQVYVNELYIVTHANEDGTLSFGLDAAAVAAAPRGRSAHLSVNELRDALHPAGGGATALADASAKIDEYSRIHIKGCDLGRTQSIVELIDEAFGGRGTVTAPTHEQVYGTDPTLGAQARAAFNRDIADSHEMPADVDPALRGAERRAALRERGRALATRGREIAAEQRARRGEADAIAERAQTYEALSGPMFQRPGTQRYTPGEIRPEVDRLYGHLSDPQRTGLVRRLVAPDRRSAAVARRDGVYRQQGQRVYHLELEQFGHIEPTDDVQLKRVFDRSIRRTTGVAANRFTVTSRSIRRVAQGAGFAVQMDFEGTRRGRDQVFTFHGQVPDVDRGDDPAPTDATMLATARGRLQNPGRYAIRLDTRRNRERVTRTVIAERVVAYLHHGSLDRARHEHFTRPLTDRDFYTESAFAPPPPPAPNPARGPAAAPAPAPAP